MFVYPHGVGLVQDLLGHDVERAALPLVGDHGVEDVAALALQPLELAVQEHVLARVAEVGQVVVQQLAGQVQVLVEVQLDA